MKNKKISVDDELKVIPMLHKDVEAKVKATETESWFYTDIVKDHFFNPRNLVRSDDELKKFSADGYGSVGSAACILPTTNIQNNPSLSLISEAKVGDKVLSHDGQFHKISQVFSPKYSEEIMTLKNQLGEMTITKDHLVYAIKVPRTVTNPFIHTEQKKKLPASWVHAQELNEGDIVLYPIPKEERNIEKISVPNQEKKKFDTRSELIPSEIPINNETLELFGYYVAEGHSRKDSGGLGFTFNIKETKYAQRVKELVKKYFNLESNIKERPSNNRIDVTINNIFMNKLFKGLFGDSALTKHAPEWLLFLNPELQSSFLKGLWRGDGYFRSISDKQQRAGFKTVSPVLARQLIWILMRLKIVPSLYKEKAKVVNGVNHRESFSIHVGDVSSLEKLASILEITFIKNIKKFNIINSWFDDNYLYMPITGVSKVNFDGRLKNLEVEDSHTYTTDAFLIHNCGDKMDLWIKVDKKNDKIIGCLFKTFGCGSAIASTSMLTVMITENGGMPIEQALKIKPQDIVKRLGDLPQRKFHCSVLGDKALRQAINDYFKKTGQNGRVVIEGAQVVDMILKITDKDIEEAVLEGAHDFEAVQKKTKVGISDKSCIPKVKELIKFYVEKYYG